MFLRPESLQYLNNVLTNKDWLNFSKDLHESLSVRRKHIASDIPLESILPATEPYIEGDLFETLGVIVESRSHPNLIPVIEEALKQLKIPVQLFHGPSNSEDLKKYFAKCIEAKRLFLSPLATDVLPSSHYNRLLLSQSFWNQLKTRQKILLFQSDAAFCNHSKYTLSDFYAFDYVGSWWPCERPVGVYAEGGNGGLSLRGWTAHYECLNKFNAANWPGAEDTFFAFYLSVMQAKVASKEVMLKFGTQHAFGENSFGAHKIGCLPKAQQERFLEYCPNAYRILQNP